MDSGWVAVILSVVFGIVAVLACIFAYLTWRDSRRRRIRTNFEIAAFLGERIPTGVPLSVVLGGELQVSKPHSVKVSLQVPAPPDVPPEAFNNSNLRIDFGTAVVWIASLSGHPTGSSFIEKWRSQFFESSSGDLRQKDPLWPKYVDIPPGLISVGIPWELTVITDGIPKPSISTQLTDVDWIPRGTGVNKAPSSSLYRRAFKVLAALVILALSFSAVKAMIESDQARMPHVIVAPTKAPASGLITVSGNLVTGPGNTADIKLGGVVIGRALAVSNGDFNTQVQVPYNARPGATEIVIIETRDARRVSRIPFVVEDHPR